MDNRIVLEAIQLLKNYEPAEGYYLAFSGGKDSIVIYDLLVKSGCKFDAHFCFTTVDPPDLVKFIKEKYPSVIIEKPEKTMFQLIEKWGYPSSKKRWCCRILKEYGGHNRVVITGIRKQESNKRSKRSIIEQSTNDNTKKLLNIIINWSFIDVWNYIHINKLEYCKLYDLGFHRIGCIGCPGTNYKNNIRMFKLYPNFKKAYLESWRRHIEYLDSREKTTILPRDPELAFEWWIKRIKLDKFYEDMNQLQFNFGYDYE